MAGQKFRCAHPPSAFALQLQNPQRILAASGNNSIFVRRQNFPGVGSPRRGDRTARPVLSILRSRATAEDGRSSTAEGGRAVPATFNCFSFPNFDQPRFRLCFPKRERARPRRERAQPVQNGPRGLIPINAAVFLFDFGRVACAFGGLRRRLDFSGDVIGNGPRKQFRAEAREPVVERG